MDKAYYKTPNVEENIKRFNEYGFCIIPSKNPSFNKEDIATFMKNNYLEIWDDSLEFKEYNDFKNTEILEFVVSKKCQVIIPKENNRIEYGCFIFEHRDGQLYLSEEFVKNGDIIVIKKDIQFTKLLNCMKDLTFNYISYE
jgi:hypothetical protein